MRRPKLVTAPEAALTTDADLSGLLTRREALVIRQAGLSADLERAISARRELLIQGGDAAAIADAERAVRDLESTALGVTDAVTELDRRVAAAEARIAADQEEAEREAAAAGLERNATDIEKAAAGLKRALEGVATAHAALLSSIAPAAAGQYDPHIGIASPADIARAFLLHGLAEALPSLDVSAEVRRWSTYVMASTVEGADPVAMAAEFGARLRETAGSIRERVIGPALPAHVEVMPHIEVPRPEMQIVALEPFTFTDAGGSPAYLPAWTHTIATPAAERAIEAGLALELDTEEGRDAFEKLKRRRESMTTSPPEHYVDLGFSLKEWRAAELSRLKDAWSAGQDRRAA
ncbi:hypothetical protein VQ03_27360 [Methylobacterium tarhaniae]|uniref:Uncharacterized protein n=1 Tax=Methylobacterium tarhaniae TaxID=1187852 RepID=A0A0J6SD78_9HYPH|nr:hypothetical protein [Methylobacterium tarhaniae]KMO31313.1 hypothetical protein VQ03_27360 [Methylobacterium tarhaniae]